MVKTRGGRSQSTKRGSSSQETQSPLKRAKTSSASLEPPSPQKPEALILSAPRDHADGFEIPGLVAKSRHSSPKKTSPKSKVPKLVAIGLGK